MEQLVMILMEKMTLLDYPCNVLECYINDTCTCSRVLLESHKDELMRVVCMISSWTVISHVILFRMHPITIRLSRTLWTCKR